MVGARLVEDSSIAASGAWSSDSSTFFIRELGPLTKARPETRSRKHSNCICLPPTTPYRPTAGPTFPAANRGGGRNHMTSYWLSRHRCCPPSCGGGSRSLGAGRGGKVLDEFAVLLGRWPRILALKQYSSKFKSGLVGCSQQCKCNEWNLVGLTMEGFLEESKFEEGSNVMRLRGIAGRQRPLRRLGGESSLRGDNDRLLSTCCVCWDHVVRWVLLYKHYFT